MEEFEALGDGSVGVRALEGVEPDKLFEGIKRLRAAMASEGLIDEASRTLLLHNALSRVGTPACCKACQLYANLGGTSTGAAFLRDKGALAKIALVCVDEVQDATLSFLLLLARLAEDPNQLFFAGDSAQAIFGGVAFSFRQMIAQFDRIPRNLAPDVARLLPVPPASVYPLGQVGSLAFNYRSDDALLQPARMIVDARNKLCPQGDRLEPDRGIFSAARPLLFLHNDFALLLDSLQVRAEGAPLRWPEADAKAAAVLVRDAQTQRALLAPEALGPGAPVFTIEESKGMEYAQVLLFNFFSCSAADWSWLQREDIGGDRGGAVYGRGYAFASIAKGEKPEAGVLRVLEHELNLLYVALTRAGRTMWLFEGALPDRDREWNRSASRHRYGRHEDAWSFFMQTSAVDPVQLGTPVEPLFPF